MRSSFFFAGEFSAKSLGWLVRGGAADVSASSGLRSSRHRQLLCNQLPPLAPWKASSSMSTAGKMHLGPLGMTKLTMQLYRGHRPRVSERPPHQPELLQPNPMRDGRWSVCPIPLVFMPSSYFLTAVLRCQTPTRPVVWRLPLLPCS